MPYRQGYIRPDRQDPTERRRRFKEAAARRERDALDALGRLERLARSPGYLWSDWQAAALLERLGAAVEAVEEAFGYPDVTD